MANSVESAAAPTTSGVNDLFNRLSVRSVPATIARLPTVSNRVRNGSTTW